MAPRIELIGAAATVISVAGVLMNNHRLWPCFLLWLASNALTMWIHWRARIWSLVARDAVFLALAVDGLIRWTA